MGICNSRKDYPRPTPAKPQLQTNLPTPAPLPHPLRKPHQPSAPNQPAVQKMLTLNKKLQSNPQHTAAHLYSPTHTTLQPLPPYQQLSNPLQHGEGLMLKIKGNMLESKKLRETKQTKQANSRAKGSKEQVKENQPEPKEHVMRGWEKAQTHKQQREESERSLPTLLTIKRRLESLSEVQTEKLIRY